MTPDHEIDWTAAGKLAENWARLCYPETPEGNLARAYLDAMAQRDEAREELAIFKRRRISETYLDGIEAQRDEATELLRTLKARLDRYESITGDDYADLRAFLAKHRKTGATDGK